MSSRRKVVPVTRRRAAVCTAIAWVVVVGFIPMLVVMGVVVSLLFGQGGGNPGVSPIVLGAFSGMVVAPILIQAVTVAIGGYQQVEDDKLVRTVDGTVLRPGEWYRNPHTMMNSTGIRDYITPECLGNGNRRNFKGGITVTYTFMVVNLESFIARMAPLDVDTYDVVESRLFDLTQAMTCENMPTIGDEENERIQAMIEDAKADLLEEFGLAMGIVSINRKQPVVELALA